MIGCAGISCYYAESVRAYSFYSPGIGGCFCLLLRWLTRGPVNLSRRDGFGVVTFGWLTVTVFGSLPYLFSGVIHHPISAFFETMSGFTTTGASVLTQFRVYPASIHFWRALTNWFGGMGVLVLCVAILPFLGVGGMQFSEQRCRPVKRSLTPRITTTAKLFGGSIFCYHFGGIAYCDLLGIWVGSMRLSYISTMSTGGFSTRQCKYWRI